MDREDDARAAVKGLDGAYFSGSDIKVEVCVQLAVFSFLAGNKSIKC